MLEITLSPIESWDEEKEEFVFEEDSIQKDVTLCLEHSLVSLSKWEAKWRKPFIDKNGKTRDELVDYIKCMTITKNVNDKVYNLLTEAHFNTISEYIDAPMTATWFSDKNNHPTREVITSEIIYYWMIALNIPFECQKWHLNRLMTLIKVCNIKNQPPKKVSRNSVLSRNAALNAERRAKMNSKG